MPSPCFARVSQARLRILRAVRLRPTPRAPRLSRSGLVLGIYAGLALLAVGLGALRGHALVALLPGRTPPGWASLVEHLGLGAAFALLVVFLSRVAAHRFEWARVLEREFLGLLGPLTGGEIVLVAAASSVGEELLFRGALLPALGPWLSSALFALPHIGPGVRFLPWTASSFVVGLAFAALFLHTGDLAAPVVAHFLINLLNLRHITERR